MRVGVIMGGISSEREISLKTGEEMLKKLDPAKYEAVPVVINKKEELAEKVRGLDLALLALHGAFGEDGTVQAVLESLNIPYTGSGVLSSAICMDKDVSKRLLRAAGIPTADWLCWNHISEFAPEAVEKLGYPVIVKPSSGGSSIGMVKVNEPGGLRAAVTEAFRWDRSVMVERYVQGTEITCPILDGRTLPALGIIPQTSEYFDFDAKYTENGALEEIAVLPADLERKVRQISLDCCRTLKCSVYARIDIIVSDGVPFVLEVNTLPGMTSASLLPKSAKAAGMTFSGLLDAIIAASLKERGVPVHVQ
ncbi:D-alanine-D-alanine ligase [Paenibacillus sophorae]|uniref:D-alanine--D-alanine ligase n=1 Tax=Paenibacillus sophorae TaxID=1333845 RepID=A0A1H8L1L5_9BACL|nr:D-alanine--D-alanine ligase [Paenibacillus sophorae]QWU17468.1 D-alanine--D-alanine ligase [Paenibacillus sophorae]SEN99017.1 D-alanine-D-alanine ligase [Paenibacillus sophorae]